MYYIPIEDPPPRRLYLFKLGINSKCGTRKGGALVFLLELSTQHSPRDEELLFLDLREV